MEVLKYSTQDLWLIEVSVLELIPCPLQAVQCIFREHLQCTVRDVIGLIGVTCTCIALS
jgi:hypothetical protein